MKEFKLQLGAHELILEVGKMAKLANGAVFARYGGTAVLSTACCSSETREGLDFVPVSVDYNERYYSAGKIPGGFLKREARPKDKEIIVSRLIDRPMRPLFNKKFGREIQVVPTTVSADRENTPDMVGMIAAFASVMVSDIPFAGPVAAVRIARVGEELLVNPTFAQIEASQLDIVVAGSHDGICMVEGGANEVGEDLMLEAIEKAEKEISRLCDFLLEVQNAAGKEKLPIVESQVSFRFRDEITAKATPKLEKALFGKDKIVRGKNIKSVKSELLDEYSPQFEEGEAELFSSLFSELSRDIMRREVLENGLRCDGRKSDEIRHIECEVGLLPRTHGSALFTRGETQSLGVTTLGSVQDEQVMDDIDGDRRNNFMLHYNFPPFCVGETGRLGTGRREIGHGHLAQRSLEPVLPKKSDFPYTIRLVSEILESNGSSSQATVCSGTLSLLNAGVPLKASVAGIAMGLIKEGDKYAVLSDILGEEDHLGDMDFKVAGSLKGITAFQMDMKITGITTQIMKEALEQACKGRLHILNIMNETINKPSETTSEYAPRSLTIKVPHDKIGGIIGTGGKTVRDISERSDAKINIGEDGTITIFAQDAKRADMASAIIRGMVQEPDEGTVYDGTVKRIMDFGAFIEFLPGKEGLCHISKLGKERVTQVSDVVSEGDVVRVKLLKVDQMGRYNLSIADA